MSKELWYVQCELLREDGALEVAWIPERFAQVGKALLIDGKVDHYPCTVLKTYSKQKASIVISKERDYMNQRKVSDR